MTTPEQDQRIEVEGVPETMSFMQGMRLVSKLRNLGALQELEVVFNARSGQTIPRKESVRELFSEMLRAHNLDGNVEVRDILCGLSTPPYNFVHVKFGGVRR